MLYARDKPDDNARTQPSRCIGATLRLITPRSGRHLRLQREDRYTGDVTPILEPFVQVAGDSLDERPKRDATTAR